MCLFNKQKTALLYTFDFHMHRFLICHLYLSRTLYTNLKMKNSAQGTGNSFNVECSQNQDFFICRNNAVKSENYSPFLHVPLPSQFSCLIINCGVQWLVSSTFHTGQDRLKTPHTSDESRHTISIYMRSETFSNILWQNSSVSQVMNYKNSSLV